MSTDVFLGQPFRWFDGDDHSWSSISGSGTSGVWDLGASTGVDDIEIKWHYGGAYWQDGSTGPPSGAAGAFVIEGSNDGTSWTTVLTDADPVGTAGASYPGDFSHTYSFATATYQYWRFRSTTSSNNDVYTIRGLADTPPPPPPDPDAGGAVDWDEDGFSAGDNDDVSQYVASWVIRRGAGPRVIDAAEPGSLSLVLNNPQSGGDADLFNPNNTGGALYAKLRDGKPVHVSVNADGALSGTNPRGLFGGLTTKIIPQPVPGATYAPTVEIQGEDGIGWYRRLPARVADAIGRSHRALRTAMLDAAGETRVDLAHETSTMPLSAWDSDLLAGLEAINQANGTRHFCKPADDRADWYSYTTRNRQWRLDATVDASVDAGSDHATATGWDLDADTVVNQQKASFVPITFSPSSRVVWKAEGLPWPIRSGAPRTIWIEFDDYVADPVVNMNHTGAALTATLTPFGRTAKLVVSTSTLSAGTVTGLTVTGRLARRGTEVSVVVDDTASQTGSRGVRSGSDISGDFVGSEAAARGIASHIVWRYADVQYRPQLVMTNWLPYQFEIDLFDVIAVTIAQLGISDELFEVVGLEHRGIIAASASLHLHEATFTLQQSRAQVDPGWFVLDTSELDSADILAY